MGEKTVQCSLFKRVKRWIKPDTYYDHGNILLTREKVIYFPIAKVACSSIKKICADLLGLDYDRNDLDDSVHEQNFPFVRRRRILKPAYEEYLKFAFVRNPWDRLFSCYKSKVLQDPAEYVRGFTDGVLDGLLECSDRFHAGMSFADFVYTVMEIDDRYADEHFRSQYLTIYDREGRLLVNYLGYFEELNRDWQYIADWIGQGNQLPRLMKSRSGSYLDHYTPELVEMVGRRFEADVELFGYVFPADGR